MVAELDRAGLTDANIEIFDLQWPSVVAAGPRRSAAFLECRLAVVGVRVGPRAGQALGYWTMDSATKAAVVSSAADWCCSIPGADGRYFLFHKYVSSAVAAERLARMAEMAMSPSADPTASSVQLFAESAGVFRMVVLSPETAHVSFVAGAVRPADFSWPESFAAVTAPLDEASWAVRGFVKRGNLWSYAGDRTLEQDWVASHANLGGLAERDLEEHGLPDAFGAVVLPASDADRLPADWDTTPIGDLVLARHPDPSTWYADPQPAAGLVSATRAALGDLLARRPPEG